MTYDLSWAAFCEALRVVAIERGMTFNPASGAPIVTAQSGSTLTAHRKGPSRGVCIMRFKPDRGDRPNDFPFRLLGDEPLFRRIHGGMELESESADTLARHFVETFSRSDRL